jgi:filamentous hemagglutinin family protein
MKQFNRNDRIVNRPTWLTFTHFGLCVCILALVWLGAIQSSHAEPNGGQVVSGDATITQQGNTTLIHQNSANAIINFQQFNIGAGQTVQFIQPDSSSRVLNRVLSADPTRIDGTLLANGQVYIVNPSGVFFGNQAVVNTAGLFAAAGNISNDDFLKQINLFTDVRGSVINEGSIQSKAVYLIGQKVANFGSIVAPDGVVILAAGDEVFLVERDQHMIAKVKGGDSANTQAAVSNTGSIETGKGSVQMAAGDMYAMAIRQTGHIKARRVELAGGNGTVEVSGEIDASNSAGDGGSVTVTGRDISLDQATINASGTTGGGVILIGGDYQGGGDLPTADYLLLGADVKLFADATQSGDGGRVILWSDDTTTFHGMIYARALGHSGDGGFSEISGKQYVSITGYADLTSVNGQAGELLIDPGQVTVLAFGTGPTQSGPNVFTDDYLNTQLGLGNLTISTAAAGGGGPEDVTVQFGALITWSSGNELTFNAGRQIVLQGDIIATNGGDLTLITGGVAVGGETVSMFGTVDVDRLSIFTSGGGVVRLAMATVAPTLMVNELLVVGNTVRPDVTMSIGSISIGTIALGFTDQVMIRTDNAFSVGTVAGTSGIDSLDTTLSSLSLASIVLDQSIIGNTVAITAQGIEQTGGGIIANTLSLVTGGGATSFFNLNGNNQVQNLNGNVQTNVVLRSNTNMTIEANGFDIDDFDLLLNIDGSLTMDGAIVANSGDVGISASGGIIDLGTGTAIDADHLSMTSGGNIGGGPGGPLNLDINSLNINVTQPGTVDLDIQGGVMINNIFTASGDITVTAGGNVIINQIIANSDVTLFVNGDVEIGQVSASEVVDITASGGAITDNPNVDPPNIVAPDVILTGDSVGEPGNPLIVISNTLTINAPGGSNVVQATSDAAEAVPQEQSAAGSQDSSKPLWLVSPFIEKSGWLEDHPQLKKLKNDWGVLLARHIELGLLRSGKRAARLGRGQDGKPATAKQLAELFKKGLKYHTDGVIESLTIDVVKDKDGTWLITLTVVYRLQKNLQNTLRVVQKKRLRVTKETGKSQVSEADLEELIKQAAKLIVRRIVQENAAGLMGVRG